MVRPVGSILALALLSILISTPLKSYAPPFELTHDDGEFDYAWSDFYPSGAR